MSTDPGDAGALRQTLIHQRYKLDRRVVVASNRVVQDWGSHPGGETILVSRSWRSQMLRPRGKTLRA
jgi:hypothetical protein